MGLFIDFIDWLWYDGWRIMGIMAEGRFYVYYLVDPRTGVPFYVGKGTGFRCYAHLSEGTHTNHNKRLYGHIRKMRKQGIEPEVIKIKEDLQEDIAYDLEAQEIKKYGRIAFDEGGILFNIMEGGFGPPALFGEDNGFYGRTHTEETKRIISEKKKGSKLSKEHRKIISDTHKGVPKSEEQKEKIREKAKQRKQTESTKEKLADHFAKLWIVTLPCGTEILVKNLNKFCKINQLNYGNMTTVASGKKKTCKGHKVRHYNPETDPIKFKKIDFE